MSSEMGDVLKLVELTQTEIDNLSDQSGLYMNSTTNKLNVDGAEISGGGGTAEALGIIVLNSTDDTQVFTRASPYTIEWDVEDEKDAAFTHSNITNNTKIEVSDTSTYSFGGVLRIFNGNDQRAQPTIKVIVDGTLQDWSLSSGYIRNSGSASDYWSFNFQFQPVKLTAGQEVELQVSHEDSNPTTFDSTFIGSESYFWGVRLQGAQGEKGDAGSGSNIVVKKNGVTIGTVTETINFLSTLAVTDSGSNTTEVTIADMLKSVYDPTGVNADAFDYANQIGITQIPDAQITNYTESGGGSVDIDNYNLGTSNVHFIDPGAHDRDFSGMVAPSAGVNRIVTIINSGTNKKLKFKDNDSASTAANRMLLADQSDFDLPRGGSAQFIYHHPSSRWITYTYY